MEAFEDDMLRSNSGRIPRWVLIAVALWLAGLGVVLLLMRYARHYYDLRDVEMITNLQFPEDTRLIQCRIYVSLLGEKDVFAVLVMTSSAFYDLRRSLPKPEMESSTDREGVDLDFGIKSGNQGMEWWKPGLAQRFVAYRLQAKGSFVSLLVDMDNPRFPVVYVAAVSPGSGP